MPTGGPARRLTAWGSAACSRTSPPPPNGPNARATRHVRTWLEAAGGAPDDITARRNAVQSRGRSPGTHVGCERRPAAAPGPDIPCGGCSCDRSFRPRRHRHGRQRRHRARHRPGVARAGASVAIWPRRAERNAEAVADLEGLGARAIGVQCDVSDEDNMAGAMRATLGRLGRLDCLVANAGTAGKQPFMDMTL